MFATACVIRTFNSGGHRGLTFASKATTSDGATMSALPLPRYRSGSAYRAPPLRRAISLYREKKAFCGGEYANAANGYALNGCSWMIFKTVEKLRMGFSFPIRAARRLSAPLWMRSSLAGTSPYRGVISKIAERKRFSSGLLPAASRHRHHHRPPTSRRHPSPMSFRCGSPPAAWWRPPPQLRSRRQSGVSTRPKGTSPNTRTAYNTTCSERPTPGSAASASNFRHQAVSAFQRNRIGRIFSNRPVSRRAG
jgi:hypothetical protein